MRILKATAHNFGSYSLIDFEFTDKGLTLISGPTGTGKSTLADIIPWGLFGVTAKGGLADEVRTWNADEVTSVVLYLESLIIVRIRGKGGKGNDLYFQHTGKDRIRGKDLNDTQRLINQHLGITPETYLAGAYFHEFSQTASFFTTSAKIRRQITEQMADLDLAKTLALELTETRKYTKKDKEANDLAVVKLKDQIEYLEHDIESSSKYATIWQNTNETKKDKLLELHDNFEANKLKTIEDIELNHTNKTIELQYDLDRYKADLQDSSLLAQKLDALKKQQFDLPAAVCSECGAPKSHAQDLILTKAINDAKTAIRENSIIENNIISLQQRLEKHNTTLVLLLAQENARENAYLEQLRSLELEINPFTDQLRRALNRCRAAKASLSKLDTSELAVQLADLDLLADLNETFRSMCLKNTIMSLEATTNKLLTNHFDAEIKVTFSAEEADKLEVLIAKDGNSCSYNQLSKGQRCLLKLCFGVAVMEAVANFQHTNFNVLWFDEAMDGLSDELKVKSTALFETLALTHESVFVVDHSLSLKALFNNKIEVSLVNGESQLEEA